MSVLRGQLVRFEAEAAPPCHCVRVDQMAYVSTIRGALAGLISGARHSHFSAGCVVQMFHAKHSRGTAAQLSLAKGTASFTVRLLQLQDECC